MANDFLFTSESVSEGHPDKLADQVSDAILDAIFKQDPRSRVAAETLANTPAGILVASGDLKVAYGDGAKFAPPVAWLPAVTTDLDALRFGDFNGDGRMDILERDGWFEQPANTKEDKDWTFHPGPFAPAGARGGALVGRGPPEMSEVQPSSTTSETLGPALFMKAT